MNRGIQNIVIGALVVAAAVIAPTGAARATVTTAESTSIGTVTVGTTLTLTVNSVLENTIVVLTNAQRLLAGCRALTSNTDLRQSARAHSKRMARAGEMSHQLPGEMTLGRRITYFGYTGWTRVAENIAAGFTSASMVTRAWWASPSHHRNIVDCSLRNIGVGVVWSGLRMYWTVDFGRR